MAKNNQTSNGNQNANTEQNSTSKRTAGKNASNNKNSYGKNNASRNYTSGASDYSDKYYANGDVHFLQKCTSPFALLGVPIWIFPCPRLTNDQESK